MLLEKTLATLASIVTQHLPLALAGLVLVVGAAVCLCEKVHTPSHWVVRKGGLPVLWQCVIWHHVGLSTPPWAGPPMPRKSLSVSDL
jgi:hypothetical protein